jgi:endonuclease YncB( thermonuclease family)
MIKPQEFEVHPIGFLEAMAQGMWRGVVKSLDDGDTYTVMLDKGHYEYVCIPIRLNGADTWEIRGAQKARGEAAKSFLEAVILNQPVLVHPLYTSKSGHETLSFARFVNTVYRIEPNQSMKDVATFIVGTVHEKTDEATYAARGGTIALLGG